MNQEKSKKKIKIEKADIAIFLILFIILVGALLSFFPGILTSDNVDQISQAENNKYFNAHPILHTFFIGTLTQLGGIWIPALIQIIIFALSWTYVCKLLRKINNSKKNAILQIIVTCIIAIMPLNFMYSITIWKDIIYSYSFLILLGLLYFGIKKEYRYTTSQIIIYSLACVTIMKFRHNGVPIGFIMFVIAVALNIFKVRKLKDTLKFVVSFISIFIVMTIPSWCVNVVREEIEYNPGVLTSTEVYCMGGLLNEDINLEQEEKEFLNTIMDVDLWRESYSPYNGTPILFSKEYHSKVLNNKENKERLDEIFIKYTKQKPQTIIKHFLSVNSIWWSIPEQYGMHSVVLSNSGVSEMSDGRYDNCPIWEYGNEKLINYIDKTMRNKFLYEFNYRPATAILISLICVVVICCKEKKKMYLVILLPMLLNIGTYVFLISSQDQRYFYPCFMTEYISVIALGASFINDKKNINKKKELKTNKNDTKTLVIIPAYNEKESIKRVVNSVYAQNIKNCDVLVVNDGSKDSTYNEAKKTKARVIDAPNNLGIGGAVQTGYLYAKKYGYDIAIQLDGDGQHDPKYIKKLIKEVSKGNDIVIGSRFIEKTNYKQKFFRMIGINMISFTTKLMTGVKIHDTTSGYRAVNRNIIEEFANSYPYDYPEPCTNMHMIKKGYKIKEIPVEMKQRETGVSSISPLQSMIYMFKVILYILLMGIKD